MREAPVVLAVALIWGFSDESTEGAMELNRELGQAAVAWAGLAGAVDALDAHDLGALHEMLKYWRATLPGSVVALVDVLDRAREATVAVMADRHGATVAEVEALIAEVLAAGGGADG
ncbi:hypothetical protein ACIBG4_14920 [Nonomuraea sp. NPDC050383]|uniref:hypothetical protein n=1 Tax=Nonomuraea sp. NPDC050383 TaxID=3364362 RepID=UPI0037A4F5C1